MLKNLFLSFTIGLSCMTTLSIQGSTPETDKLTLIPRHLLFGNPEKTSPQLSPDATKLAYLAPDSNGVLNVWVRDLTGKEKEDKLITSDRKRGVRSFQWQLDNEHILYGQDIDGDENWHIFQTSLATKDTKDLTPFEGSQAGIVDYDHRFPHEMLVQINHRDKGLFDVYRLNLKTGDCQLDTENPDHVFSWVADHNLQVRVCQSYTKEGDTLIRVRDNAQAPWREFLTVPAAESECAVVGFTADDQALYILSSIDTDTSRLTKMPLSGNKSEVIVEDPHYDIDDIMINPVTYQLEAAGVEREKFEWIVLDPSLTKDFEFLYQKSPKGVFRLVSRDLANRQWVVAFTSDQRPAQFYLYDRKSKNLTFLFTTQPKLEQYTLSSMTPIKFQAQDGMMIHGYLTLPAHKQPHNLPTVLLVHGGPWARDSWGLSPSVQWLANRGYAVLQINFRGSTGYGKKYMNAGDREWGAKMHTDLLDGKKWMIDKGYANPDKIAIYGGSYGGYATLVGLTFTPDEFCCGVDIVGPSNIITLLQTFPPYWAPLKSQMDRRVGKLETEEEFLKSRSPLFKADQIKKPLLIGQGANDPRVKQSESDQIVQAMRQKNIPVEYLLFADEGHGFARPENRLKFYAAAEEFLSRYLGGQYQHPSEEENWESLKK